MNTPYSAKKIHSKSCEINASHQCNLNCRGCSHAAPIMKKKFCDPEVVFKDLSLLSKVYECEYVTILGGEPLLHPEVLSLIDAVQSSGLGCKIRVTTNGLLLNRVTDQFWENIDQIYISLYPGHQPSKKNLEKAKTLATLHKVDFSCSVYNYFRETISFGSKLSDRNAARVYKECEVRNIWQCHTVEDGRFYKCPQSMFISRDIYSLSSNHSVLINNSNDLQKRLSEFLISEKPLEACSHCLGSVGKLFRWENKPQKFNWREKIRSATEMLDFEYLSYLESGGEKPDSRCRSKGYAGDV